MRVFFGEARRLFIAIRNTDRQSEFESAVTLAFQASESLLMGKNKVRMILLWLLRSILSSNVNRKGIIGAHKSALTMTVILQNRWIWTISAFQHITRHKKLSPMMNGIHLWIPCGVIFRQRSEWRAVESQYSHNECLWKPLPRQWLINWQNCAVSECNTTRSTCPCSG